jgi:hypothetical protein
MLYCNTIVKNVNFYPFLKLCQSLFLSNRWGGLLLITKKDLIIMKDNFLQP